MGGGRRLTKVLSRSSQTSGGKHLSNWKQSSWDSQRTSKIGRSRTLHVVAKATIADFALRAERKRVMVLMIRSC